MRLNTLKPTDGSKKTAQCLGRGIGCGKGKTCGHGHKGQKGRKGVVFHREGTQGGAPRYRRFPKFGFTSQKARFRKAVRLSTLEKINEATITLDVLKKNGLIGSPIRVVKVIYDKPIQKALKLSGLLVTQNVKRVIESSGGQVE